MCSSQVFASSSSFSPVEAFSAFGCIDTVSPDPFKLVHCQEQNLCSDQVCRVFALWAGAAFLQGGRHRGTKRCQILLESDAPGKLKRSWQFAVYRLRDQNCRAAGAGSRPSPPRQGTGQDLGVEDFRTVAVSLHLLQDVCWSFRGCLPCTSS